MYDKIQQGDHYAIPFRLYYSGKQIVNQVQTATAEVQVQGIKIQIENIVRTWPNGELIPNTNEGPCLWLFPLSESESRSLPEHARWQFAVKTGSTYGSSGTEYHYSSVGNLDVLWSLMNQNWDDTSTPTLGASAASIPHNHQLIGENEEVTP